MKKTLLRSLIVGLFAVVSLNASADMNYDYMYYYFEGGGRSGSMGDFYDSWEYLEPYSSATYEIDAFPDPNDNCDRTGQQVRVVWGPDFSHSGLLLGDELGVYGINETGASISWQGTNAVYETIVEVDYEGHFWLALCSGQTAGSRSFGPIFYWARCWEDSFLGGPGVVNWNVVWGWSAWVDRPVGWYRY